MTKTTADLDARLQRVERILLALSAQTYGVAFGTGQGISWAAIRRQAQLDAAQILAEQTSPMETRGAA